jgi:glycosyltransferase involved in cell wall biosynthesis
MKIKKIIFHYPGAFYDVLDAGEKKRPKKMYEAFCQLGYDVYLINGTYSERKENFNKIKKSIDEYVFIYSENSTLPLRCSGKKHLPVYKNVDIELYKLAKKHNIPHGVFCRDIYWCYKDFIKEVGMLKYLVSISFYLEEMKLYHKYADTVFVPSKRFAENLPIVDKVKCVILPPAGDDTENLNTQKNTCFEPKLKLIYVGSVAPPFYDITKLLKNIRYYKDSLHLTIVTREDGWNKFSDYYENIGNNIEVLHLSGNELKNKLKKSHISVIYLQETKYRKLAMPLKLFEAVGSGLPIISYGDCAVSDFVKKNGIGWCVYPDDKKSIFEYLLEHSEEIEQKKKYILAIQNKHSWKARAEKVATVLTAN